MLLAHCKALNSPHRISRRRPLRQAQGSTFDPSTSSVTTGSGTSSASATPPQGGSDWTVKRARALTSIYLGATENSDAAPGEVRE